MVHRAGQGAFRDLQTLFDLGSTGSLGDRRLLELFADRRDSVGEAAFATIVQRHGPMVLRVCTSVLGDGADASDAFQATFLVLVRKRAEVEGLESLAGWLHGVACRVAAKARVDRARRRKAEERGGLRVVEAAPDDAPERAELDLAVQREVARLPEKYRSVVVLCYWEGLTQEQAADRLDRPIGTVRSRLARARDILRKRLTRQGLALGESSLGALVLGSVPSSLVRSTIAVAVQALAGRAAGVSAALAASIIWSMTMSKVLKVVAAGSFLAAGIVGASLSARPTAAPEPPHQAKPVAKQAKHDPEQSYGPKHVVGPPDMLLVELLEALPGRPISGERLVRPDGSISLGFYGDVQVAGLTLPETKKKIIKQLQKFMTDEVLGLVEIDPETGEPRQAPGKDGKMTIVPIPPEESSTVFVDVTVYNSVNYYVEGEVVSPSRLPRTGGETVLDSLHYCGGLTPSADRAAIHLVRTFPPGSEVRLLPIDYEEITMGTDSSTNYRLLPGDRLVVPQLKNAPRPEPKKTEPAKPRPLAPQASSLGRLEQRLSRLESKLDQVLAKLESKDRPERTGK